MEGVAAVEAVMLGLTLLINDTPRGAPCTIVHAVHAAHAVDILFKGRLIMCMPRRRGLAGLRLWSLGLLRTWKRHSGLSKPFEWLRHCRDAASVTDADSLLPYLP